jgi:hypothetical protein
MAEDMVKLSEGYGFMWIDISEPEIRQNPGFAEFQTCA